MLDALALEDVCLGDGAVVALPRGVACGFVVVVRFAVVGFECVVFAGVRAEDAVTGGVRWLAEEARAEVFVVEAI